MGRTVWFPGHMARGLRQLDELAKKLDVIVEVRDARAPDVTGSHFSERIARLRPVWLVLAKSDLAEEEATARWLSFFREQGRMTWAFDLRKARVEPFVRVLARQRPGHREARAAVIGIPNVGKSLFLNLIVGKSASRVGAMPGVTRGVSWSRGKGFVVVDSPGIVDPRADPAVHRCLSWLGCEKTEVIGGHASVALDFLSFLEKRKLAAKVLEPWGLTPEDEDPEALLQRIGVRLGCLVKGGEVDMERAARRFLESFAMGKLGRVSLETPELRFAGESP